MSPETETVAHGSDEMDRDPVVARCVCTVRNVIESLVLFAGGEEIGLEDLPTEYRMPSGQTPASSTGPWQARPMAEIEREAILRTLEFTNGHRARAAKLLGIGLRTLQRKLKEYGEVASRGDGDDG